MFLLYLSICGQTHRRLSASNNSRPLPPPPPVSVNTSIQTSQCKLEFRPPLAKCFAPLLCWRCCRSNHIQICSHMHTYSRWRACWSLLQQDIWFAYDICYHWPTSTLLLHIKIIMRCVRIVLKMPITASCPLRHHQPSFVLCVCQSACIAYNVLWMNVRPTAIDVNAQKTRLWLCKSDNFAQSGWRRMFTCSKYHTQCPGIRCLCINFGMKLNLFHSQMKPAFIIWICCCCRLMS